MPAELAAQTTLSPALQGAGRAAGTAAALPGMEARRVRSAGRAPLHRLPAAGAGHRVQQA